MTTATHTTVDWVRLTLGGKEIPLSPTPGIELRLIFDSVPASRGLRLGGFDALTPPGPLGLRVSVDLIATTRSAVAQCESWATRVAAQLGADGRPLEDVKEFSLEAALGGGRLPNRRVSVPHLTLSSGPPSFLDEVEPLSGVRVFTATARTGGDGILYQLRLED